MSGSFRTCPHCQRFTLNQRCDNPECTGPGVRTTMPVEREPDLTYSYDPVPVDFDADERRWEKLRTGGGNVVDTEGRIVARLMPGVLTEPSGYEIAAKFRFRKPKAADIADAEFLAALDPAGAWTSWAVVTERLRYPAKVVLAKARILIDRRETVHGCPCGCYGGWHRADECEGC